MMDCQFSPGIPGKGGEAGAVGGNPGPATAKGAHGMAVETLCLPTG